MTAMVALKSIIDIFNDKNKKLIFCGLNSRIEKKLEKAHFNIKENFDQIEDAINFAKSIKS